MSQTPSREVPAGGVPTESAGVGWNSGDGGAQAPVGGTGSQLPATGPIVLDASFVIALLRRDPGASALAHVLPRGVMTSVTAGEVFAAIAEAGGPDPERVEGVLRALGLRIVDTPLAATRHFPRLHAIDATRYAEQKTHGEVAPALTLADLCVLSHALNTGAPVLTVHHHWTTLAAHGLSVPVHLY